MKAALFLLPPLFAASNTKAAPTEILPDNCLSEYHNYAKEIALRLSCDIADISKRILAQQEEVPAVLYHYGEKKFLLADAKANNIPADVWKSTIMGDDNRRYDINDLRRGLYGTYGLDTNYFYTPEKYDWLMKIDVKKECRDPAKVASLMALQHDPRFIQWADLKKDELPMPLEEFRNKCEKTDEYHHIYEDERCVRMADLFVTENDIKVIQDHIVAKSFYLRDRNCVEGIHAEPEDLINAFADDPSLWIQSCETFLPRSEKGFLPWRILYSILTEEDLSKVSNDTFDRLEANSKLLHPVEGSGPAVMKQILDSYLQARAAGKVALWQAAVKKVRTPGQEFPLLDENFVSQIAHLPY